MINYAENSLDRQIQIPRPPRILSRIFGFVEQIKELAKKPPVERPPEPASPSHLLLHNPPHAFQSHILLQKPPPQKSPKKTDDKASPKKKPMQKEPPRKPIVAKDPPRKPIVAKDPPRKDSPRKPIVAKDPPRKPGVAKEPPTKASVAKDPPASNEKKFEINVEKKAYPKEPMIFKEI